MKIFTAVPFAHRCALLCCVALLAVGCMQRKQEVVAEPAYQPPVFEFARGDLAGETDSGFQPVINPLYPTLPKVVDQHTSEQQLASMAMQVALSEHARKELSADEVPMRHQDIMAFWLPQYEIVQEIIRENLAQREAIHQYEMREARRRTDWQRDMQAMQLEWDDRLRREELRVLPLVPPDLHARLIVQMRTADPQRSRWCAVAP